MTGLTLRERRALRATVTAEVDRLSALIGSLTHSFDDIVAAQQLVNTDDEHDPEGTTIAFERSQTRALLDQVLADRDALRATLTRLEERAYGACEHCHGSIGVERLMALPATQRCIRCAT